MDFFKVDFNYNFNIRKINIMTKPKALPKPSKQHKKFIKIAKRVMKRHSKTLKKLADK